MRKNIAVQKIALVGVLAALSLGIYAAEAMIPMSNIGGIKLGLANVVTLCALIFSGRVSACCVLGIRILLAAAFYGTFVSFMFSLAGGALACAVMCLLIGVFDRRQLWVVSVFGAIAHNAGQLCVAAVITGTSSVVSLAPYLLISAIGTGVLTGLTAQRLWFSPLKRFAHTK